MIRILWLDWKKVPESEKSKALGRLLRYIAAHGGMISEDNQIFITEDLEKPRQYNILKNVFTLNKIEAYEWVTVTGLDGLGRVF